MIETIKQVSVFLENKPGRLAKVLSALAKEKVNVTALTVMDSHEHSALRLVTGDPAKTVQVLNAAGFRHAESDVLLVELKNQPGALAHVCELLANDHINIDYCYASSGGRNGKVYGVFKATNLDRAKQLLGGGGSNNKRPERKTVRNKRVYSGPAR
jgi:hypothetical protein